MPARALVLHAQDSAKLCVHKRPAKATRTTPARDAAGDLAAQAEQSHRHSWWIQTGRKERKWNREKEEYVVWHQQGPSPEPTHIVMTLSTNGPDARDKADATTLGRAGPVHAAARSPHPGGGGRCAHQHTMPADAGDIAIRDEKMLATEGKGTGGHPGCYAPSALALERTCGDCQNCRDSGQNFQSPQLQVLCSWPTAREHGYGLRLPSPAL